MNAENIQSIGMGTALIVCGIWVFLYFWRVMPWVKRRLGERLGVSIVEQPDYNLPMNRPSSSWEAEEDASLKTRMTIWLVEAACYIFLLILPIVLILIQAFIILDNAGKP